MSSPRVQFFDDRNSPAICALMSTRPGYRPLPFKTYVGPCHREVAFEQDSLGASAIQLMTLNALSATLDVERCALRADNVHSADGWDDVLRPVVARYQGKVSRIYFRADAAFAMPEVYEFLEAERIKYAIRLPANQILQHRIGYLLKRP